MSVYHLVFLVFIGLFFGGAMLWRRRMARSAETQHANAALGVVAQRLGLGIAAGDPQFNLVVWENSAPQVSNYNPLPHQVFDYRLEAHGTPQGRPCRFFFVAQRHASANVPITGRTITDTYACVLEVQVQAQLPYFELVSVSQNAYLQAEPVHASRTDMRQCPGAFQNPAYDAAFTLTSSDPRIAPLLARVLPLLSGVHWIHLVGEPGRLSCHFPRAGHYMFAAQAEGYQQALLSLAAMAEGRA
jgi:hypothetical protein